MSSQKPGREMPIPEGKIARLRHAVESALGLGCVQTNALIKQKISAYTPKADVCAFMSTRTNTTLAEYRFYCVF